MTKQTTILVTGSLRVNRLYVLAGWCGPLVCTCPKDNFSHGMTHFHLMYRFTYTKFIKLQLLLEICQPRWLSWMCVQLVIRRLPFQPPPSWQHSFMGTDYEIFSMVILSPLLIQEGQLSVSGERMCTILVNRLED